MANPDKPKSGKLKRQGSELSSASACESTTSRIVNTNTTIPAEANHSITTDATATQNTPAADGAAAQGNTALSQANELRRQKKRVRKRVERAQKANVDRYKERLEDLVVTVDTPVPRENFKSADGQHVVRIISVNMAPYTDYQRVAGYLGLANTAEIKKLYDDKQVMDIVNCLFQQESKCWGMEQYQKPAMGHARWNHNNIISAFFDDEGGMSKQLRAYLDRLNEGDLWTPSHEDEAQTVHKDYVVSVCTIGRAVGMIRLMQCQPGLFKESQPAELRFSAEDINRAINLYRTLTRGDPKQVKPAIPAQYAHPKGSSGPDTEAQGTDTHIRLLSNAEKRSSRTGTESDLMPHSQHSHSSQKHPALDEGEHKVLKAIESLRDEVRDVHDSMHNEITGLRNDMVALTNEMRRYIDPDKPATM